MQVLVTGAAGLVGRELCATLAERGHGVVALVHRSRTIARSDGAPIETLPWSGAMPAPGKIVLLAGDVTEPVIGVPESAARTLHGRLDVTVHTAALTTFNLDPADYARVNVGGVAHALAFAEAAAIPFLHVSTAYVCGERDGAIAEAPSPGPFANGYEASKAQGEALVLAAHGRGHPVAIARPSIVVGRSHDGAIGQFSNLYQLVRLVAEGRIRVIPAASGASLDLVPIDHVAGALADLAERMPAASGSIVHIASGAPVTLDALAPALRCFPHLHVPQFMAPDRFDPGPLTERERWLSGQVMSRFATYLRRSPLFETRNLAALTGRTCPPTDGAFLRRVLGFAIAAGYLPAA